MEKREKFSSRLGFILISAGCAIGIGNVWRFPYITGQYGGAAFVLIYLLFLVILGLPIMVMENEYQLNLFNGDIGVILLNQHQKLAAFFESTDGFREIPLSRLPHHEAMDAL